MNKRDKIKYLIESYNNQDTETIDRLVDEVNRLKDIIACLNGQCAALKAGPVQQQTTYSVIKECTFPVLTNDSQGEWCRVKELKVKIDVISKRLINNVRNTSSPKVIAKVSYECGKELQALFK